VKPPALASCHSFTPVRNDRFECGSFLPAHYPLRSSPNVRNHVPHEGTVGIPACNACCAQLRYTISHYRSAQRCAAIFPDSGMEHSQDDPSRSLRPPDGGRDDLLGEVMRKKRHCPDPRGARRSGGSVMRIGIIPDPTKPKTIALVHPFYCEGASAWTLVIDPLSCDVVPIPFVI